VPKMDEARPNLQFLLASGPLMAFFTPVLTFVFWVFVCAYHLSTTFRARDRALYGFILNVFCHFFHLSSEFNYISVLHSQLTIYSSSLS
jgi:hypothetical protein